MRKIILLIFLVCMSIALIYGCQAESKQITFTGIIKASGGYSNLRFISGDDIFRLHITLETSIDGFGALKYSSTDSHNNETTNFAYDSSKEYKVSGIVVDGHFYADVIRCLANQKYDRDSYAVVSQDNRVLPDNKEYKGAISEQLIVDASFLNPQLNQSPSFIQSLKFTSEGKSYSLYLSDFETTFPENKNADKNGWMDGRLYVDLDCQYIVKGVLINDNLYATSFWPDPNASCNEDSSILLSGSRFFPVDVSSVGNSGDRILNPNNPNEGG